MILIWRTYWFVTSLCSLVGALFARVCRAKERSKMVEGFPELQVAKIIEKGNYKIIIYSARSFADGTHVSVQSMTSYGKGQNLVRPTFFFLVFFQSSISFFFCDRPHLFCFLQSNRSKYRLLGACCFFIICEDSFFAIGISLLCDLCVVCVCEVFKKTIFQWCVFVLCLVLLLFTYK